MHEIVTNFQFLLVEIERQVEAAMAVIEKHDERAIAKIEARDDYIDNLKSVIENGCFATLLGAERLTAPETARVRALNIIGNNLERVGDHVVNVVRQTRHYDEPECIKRYAYKPFFAEVKKALEWTPKAVLERDMSAALKICRCELHLDRLYKEQFDRIRDELRSGFQTGDLLTTLFIFRYLERMGDALLNVGEAAIFAITGDKFKIHQFTALKDILTESGHELPLTEIDFESIWGTRSGCRIGRVADRDGKGESGREVIFKDGDTAKLRKEASNIEHWEGLMPGLVPRVEAFREGRKSSSMLIELLPGQTIQDIALGGELPLLRRALSAQCRVAGEIWKKTLERAAVPAGTMAQLRSRLGEVLTVHPGFRSLPRAIGNYALPNLDDALRGAEAVEAGLAAPFTVLLHGDYNSNNILYDAAEDRIHYIDLHRSAPGDLAQDTSVFMVSNFRLPVFDASRRRILNAIIAEFFEFARGFAARNGDDTFELRVALGLARSYITSTRFELSERFSRLMFSRGMYLLGRVAGHAGAPAAFRLPLAAACY
ncbi:PhoU domain-containing protein [Solidesulfovibrio sp.]|uniref:PhoU domain-containing protein n=1 Tax=Solidesulfovibrio sp. TaxID=2910990 RepID=UPI002B20EBAB|nr:PhoU domain-containing protein [Solidesulfovibrio sp.]MEA5090185.1 PhoU domain-containing protein [Solidesulfovibrio sp.]HML59851.1 PhoU domain-containing protein [Solidesulfovibrio sp.]